MDIIYIDFILFCTYFKYFTNNNLLHFLLSVSMSQTQHIIKQGFLEKKSRHLGAWRQRWTVLITDKKENNVYRLCTFSKRDNYNRQTPTEYIRIDTSTEIKVTSWNGNEFYVSNKELNEKFLFTATSADVRDEWVQSLLLKTDVASLSGNLFEDSDYCHHIQSDDNNGSIQRKKRRNSRRRTTNGIHTNLTPDIHTIDSIQSHIDKMKKKQIINQVTTNGFKSKSEDRDIKQKIMHWIEMEILLKTSNNAYFKMIVMNEFDNLEIIQKITMENLSEIGIENIEHRIQIMEIIAKIPVLVSHS